MKNFTYLLYVVVICFLGSCQNDDKQEACYDSEDEFIQIVDDLNQQFSESAGYQSIMISYDKSLGNSIMVKVCKDMTSDVIEEWFFMNGKWNKTAERKLKLEDKQITDFLFSLQNDYDISKLVKLVSESKEKVKKEKKLNEVLCKSINLLMKSDRISSNKMDDLITQISIVPKEGGATYNISYDAAGNFQDIIE